MNRILILSFAAGMISAGLFLLVTALGLGFFFLFIPTLPLLCLGLQRDERIALFGSIFAAFAIMGIGGAELAMLYMLLLGLPSWFIAKQMLLSRSGNDGKNHWYPMGKIFITLTLCGCAVIALMTFYYMGDDGGIHKVIADHLRDEFKDLEARHGEILQQLADQWSFLVFAMTVWCWCLTLYAHAWMATRILAYKHKAIRNSVALEVFTLPNWFFSLLAIAALASLIGSPSLQFLGKATLVSLMFPYFLLGAALMHRASINWPSRRFFLVFVYVMIIAQLWPVFILSGVGFYHHIKGLKAAPTSSKS